MPASFGTMPTASSLPVGIFDSGIGGLSVMHHIHQQLPGEDLLYFADSGYAPYGDKTDAEIIARSMAAAGFLHDQGIKALVVACNTATAIAVEQLRQHWPQLIIIGIEPALKPAAQLTHTKIVGVLATHGTLHSQRFAALRQRMSQETGVQYLLSECIGLADQVEKGELQSPATARLLHQYALPLLQQGADTLVLGCTHYPFVRPLLEDIARNAGFTPTILDTGEAIARQLHKKLREANLLKKQASNGQIHAYTTSSQATLENALSRLLSLQIPVTALGNT